ncbi:MAG: C40 family peptidase [Actinobacteria bacterium]|nr:C40 family peptidase [Actinomycetota bacterium]
MGRASAQTADELSDDIDAKRQEAAEIASEVERLGVDASMAVEEYRQAQVALDSADAALFETRRRVEGLRVRLDATRSKADGRIVAMYRGESAPDPMSLLDARDARELGVRQHYAGVVARRDQRILGQLSAQRQDLEDQEESLAVDREAVARQAEELKARQAEVEGVMAERQAALGQAQGELATLVAEEQQRRAAEEEARARAAAQRRAEEEARRRAATSTTSSTTTSTLPLDPAAPTTAPAPVDPAPTPADVPPVHPRAGEAVQTALAQVGKPYQWGANGPDSFDCSGLTSYAWASVGVRIPRSSGLQQQALPPVPFEAIQPGDLLFFGDPVHHVGIYMGDGKMVNAPFTGTEVRIDSIYRRDFAGAGRPG